MEGKVRLIRYKPVATEEAMGKLHPQIRTAVEAVHGEKARLFVGRVCMKENRFNDFSLEPFEVLEFDDAQMGR